MAKGRETHPPPLGCKGGPYDAILRNLSEPCALLCMGTLKPMFDGLKVWVGSTFFHLYKYNDVYTFFTILNKFM